MYSERVKQLVAELPYSGQLAEATHRGRSENPVCGDLASFELRVQDEKVTGCRFRATGCVAAIAAAAALAEMCQHQPVPNCLQITCEDLLEDLGPLPTHKIHAVNLALEALRKALHQPPL